MSCQLLSNAFKSQIGKMTDRENGKEKEKEKDKKRRTEKERDR